MAEGEYPKKRKYKTHFTTDYTKVYPCLIKVNHNDSLARCTICNSDFSIAHGRLNNCKRHVEVSSTSFISCAYYSGQLVARAT